ncbi:hypothetical protein DSL92_05400 [Billgrantia gudaonensis]|uniref:Prepilin peptidase A24 N-terminal domain-containing protein n=1 Tax=Billgrantia gudaonensis TaxID=376427 RepID=A0A3S0QFW9_9GAMM|nr:hypothetical protein DSL92_05400 [Halomonas gudaonensis]
MPALRAFNAWHDNLAAARWFKRRGYALHCGSRISPQYPLVELVGGVLTLASGAKMAPPGRHSIALPDAARPFTVTRDLHQLRLFDAIDSHRCCGQASSPWASCSSC